MKADVVVIGAGVAGLRLSQELEKNGINHIILEQNSSIGKYGNRVVNNEVRKKLNLSGEEVIRPIKEINFYSPSEIKISKKSQKTRGFVTNIKFVEKRLYDDISMKESIKLGHVVNNIDFENGIVKTNNSTINSKIIIIASGIIQTRFRNLLDLETPKIVFCFANEIHGNDEITTILDNELAHGFYGWVMPLQEGIIEVGFGTDMISGIKNIDLRERLLSLSYLRNFKQNHIIRELGGFIPTSMSNKICGKNWILIGDASGGEPLMGGSIHKSIDEAEIAAKIITNRLEGKIDSLESYQNMWNEKLGDELKEQEKIRDVFENIKNEELDEVFRRLQGKRIEGEGLINDLFKNIISNLMQR